MPSLAICQNLEDTSATEPETLGTIDRYETNGDGSIDRQLDSMTGFKSVTACGRSRCRPNEPFSHNSGRRLRSGVS